MMDIKSGIKLHNEKWEERTGEKSDFARTLSPTSRNAWRIIRKMPEKTVENVLNGVKAIPDITNSEECQTQTHNSKGSAICASLIATIPPALCATIGSHFSLPSWIVGTSTLAVAAISTGVSYKMYMHKNTPTSVRKETVHLEIDDASIQAVLEDSQKMLQSLVDYLSSCDEDANIGFDVTKDKAFGEWIQKFVNYANRNENNNTLYALKGEIISKLSTMGITVYDELLTDEHGVLILPDSDYYEDARTGTGYTKVNRAVVYSRRRLLARGEIS